MLTEFATGDIATKSYRLAAKPDGSLLRIDERYGEPVVEVKNLVLPILQGKFAALNWTSQTSTTDAEIKRLLAIAKEIERIAGEIGFLKTCQQGGVLSPWTLCEHSLRPLSHLRYNETGRDIYKELAKLN